MRTPRHALLGGIALVLLIPACEEESPVAPPMPPPAPVPAPHDYPLAIGNRWEIERKVVFRYEDPGGLDVLPPDSSTGRAFRQIIGEEVIAGQTYLVEWERFIIDGTTPDTIDTWERFRQDSTGLYRAAVDERVPPGLLPPGSVVSEAVLLAYPLEVGATWNRAGISYAHMTVEGEDTLTVCGREFVAWRLRVDFQGARPYDYAFDWFARPGLARSVRHRETNAMDPGTGEIVVIIRHETWDLANSALGAGAVAAEVRRNGVR